jgi:hypothetical protein
MGGKGLWTLQKSMRNCRNCPVCRENPSAQPHGPYCYLRRRNPDEYKQLDQIYLGIVDITEEQLEVINASFTGAELPTREEVVSLLETAGEIRGNKL